MVYKHFSEVLAFESFAQRYVKKVTHMKSTYPTNSHEELVAFKSIKKVLNNTFFFIMFSFLPLKVRPPQLGSCKAIKNDRGPSSLVLGNHGILSGFLRKLNFNRASPLALSVLNSTREGTTCGKMLSVLSKTKVRRL